MNADSVIGEGVAALLRYLERARVEGGPLVAMTGHLQTNDGEVRITVRADGTASAAYGANTVDITPALKEALE
jgi:hypothetical protein